MEFLWNYFDFLDLYPEFGERLDNVYIYSSPGQSAEFLDRALIKARLDRADGPEIYQYSTVKRKWQAIFVGHRRISVLFSMSLDIQIFVCILSRSKLCQALLKKLMKVTETTSDLVAIRRGSFAEQTNWETLSTPPNDCVVLPAPLNSVTCKFPFDFSHIL